MPTNKRYGWFLLVALLPLLVININTFHNWGDDFAQYLCAARDMFDHADNQGQQMYHNQQVSPLHRGAAFSLLLSPLYALFGLWIPAYMLFVSCCLVICVFVLYRYYKNMLPFSSNELTALVLVLLFAYNRHVLFLKTEILPVFPMIALLYLCLWWYREPFHKRLLGPSLALAVMLGLSNLAWVFFAAIGIFQLFALRKNFSFPHLNIFLFNVLLPVLLFSCLKWLVFGAWRTDELSWYAPVFRLSSLFDLLHTNALYYKDVFFLSFDRDIWFVFNKGVKWLMLLMMLIGMVYKWRRDFALEDLFFVCYLLLLLGYPDRGSGIRFLMPVVPVIFLYTAHACRFFFDRTQLPQKQWAALLYAAVFCTSLLSLPRDIRDNARLSEGPYEPEAQACWAYIADSTKATDAVAFCKPWIIRLYAQRSAMPMLSTRRFEDIKKDMKKYGITYVLFSLKKTPPEIYQPQALAMVQLDTTFTCVYANANFRLYRMKGGL